MTIAQDNMRQALREANDAMKAADQHANAMVDFLIGESWSPTPERLRHVSEYRLKRLKAALRDFDANARKWKEQR